MIDHLFDVHLHPDCVAACRWPGAQLQQRRGGCGKWELPSTNQVASKLEGISLYLQCQILTHAPCVVQKEPSRQGAIEAIAIEPAVNLQLVANALLSNEAALERTGLGREDFTFLQAAVENLEELPKGTTLLYSFNRAFGNGPNAALEKLCRECPTLRRVAISHEWAFAEHDTYWMQVGESIAVAMSGSGRIHRFFIFQPRVPVPGPV